MQLISMWFFALDQIYAYNFSPHVKVRQHWHPHLNKHNLKKFDFDKTKENQKCNC